jgi:hypothetical protein
MTMTSVPLSDAAARSAARILQLAADLEREGKLAEVGGIAYLLECVDAAERDRRPGETIEDVGIRNARAVIAAAEKRKRETGPTPA